jgi:hypothetical protein
MVTLSPFCGTELLAQFIPSDQLVPSPPPVHVWLDDALAAVGAIKAAARTPVPAARVPAAAIRVSRRQVAEPNRLMRNCCCLLRAARAGGVMVTSSSPERTALVCETYPFAFIPGKDYPGITLCGQACRAWHGPPQNARIRCPHRGVSGRRMAVRPSGQRGKFRAIEVLNIVQHPLALMVIVAVAVLLVSGLIWQGRR